MKKKIPKKTKPFMFRGIEIIPDPKHGEGFTVYKGQGVGVSKAHLGMLNNLIDDSTTYVTIPTPKNWKCEKKGCTTSWKHTHTSLFSTSDAKK